MASSSRQAGASIVVPRSYSSVRVPVERSAIEVAVRRHAEAEALSEKVSQLETALARRAVIERAKGILMERHGIDERAAFELLREHARSHSRTVVAVAQSVAEGHALLPKAG